MPPDRLAELTGRYVRDLGDPFGRVTHSFCVCNNSRPSHVPKTESDSSYRPEPTSPTDFTGEISQANPHYWMNGEQVKTVGSLKADILKMGAHICNECNSKRTQPHDFAWVALSAWLNNFALDFGREPQCGAIASSATIPAAG